MFTVVHQGTCPAEGWPTLVEEIGPDGRLTATRRLEPGYLGSLLLAQPDPLRPGHTGFMLIEMWDEHHTGPSQVAGLIMTTTLVNWLRAPSAFSAIR